MDFLFFCSLAVAFVGFGCTYSYTSTTKTPNGVRVEKVREDPVRREVEVTTDTRGAYDECFRQLAPTLGSARAGVYCRNDMRFGPSAGAFGPGLITYGPDAVPIMGPAPRVLFDGGNDAMPVVINSTDPRVVRELKKQNDRICELEKQAGRPCKK